MKIRSMQVEDVKQIIKLENELFTSAWGEKDFMYELQENPYSHLYVLEREDEIIGYYDLWTTFETAQLCNIGIKKTYQGKGLSNILMNHLIQLACQKGCEVISLEVRVSNTKAKRVYEKFGFIEANIKKGYYQDNFEDACYMIKPLGGNV